MVYQREHDCTPQDSLQIVRLLVLCRLAVLTIPRLEQVMDLALALRYLHERDSPIVHFNVCSENLLIDNLGRGVLGGLGFSKVASGYHFMRPALTNFQLGTLNLRESGECTFHWSAQRYNSLSGKKN